MGLDRKCHEKRWRNRNVCIIFVLFIAVIYCLRNSDLSDLTSYYIILCCVLRIFLNKWGIQLRNRSDNLSVYFLHFHTFPVHFCLSC